MRTRTSLGAAALAISLAAVAFGPVLNARTDDGIRMHQQKHEQFDSRLVFDPFVRVSAPAAACVDATDDGKTNPMAGIFPCSGVDLLSFTHINSFGPSAGSAISSDGGSDVWGWTADDGQEFVVMGKVTGVTFVNVTDPTAPLLLGNLKIVAESQGFIWYDIKMVGDHAYIVSESPAAGLLVFDMNQLVGLTQDASRTFQPSSVYPLTGSAHNIVANEAAEMVYVVGGNNGLAVEDICRGSLHAIDVSMPEVPTFAGCYLQEGGYGVAGSLVSPARVLSRYVHDAHCVRYDGPDTEHAGKDICITSAEDHVSIVDMTDPALPVLLSLVQYDKPSYTHQGWLSPDMATFYLGDELDEEEDPGKLHTRTMVLDVSDLDAGKVSFIHEAGGFSIDHNMYTRENALFQSNYSSGLRILDTSKVVSDKTLTEVAYFDVRPTDNSTTYSGTWSNYPYFESGTVVISGYDGLFLVRVQDKVAVDLGLREPVTPDLHAHDDPSLGHRAGARRLCGSAAYGRDPRPRRRPHVTRRVPELSAKLQDHTTTIFTEMTALAMRHGAVNLGQGAPDFSGPSEVLEAAVESIRAGRNQYAPGPGVLPLREAIAAHQERVHGLTYDPATEITVTAGATEALTAAIVGLCDPGDEVVAFAPTYDSYGAACAIAGARLQTVVLRGEEAWTFDEAQLRAAVTDDTRLLLLNTPHNPSGRVFTDEELALVAELCIRHDVVAVTDEVYEHLWFDGHRHRSLATLEGMRERTVVISSAGKTFSVTGWKVGWACAPPSLTAAVLATKQWLSFSNATPMQFAIAHALSMPGAWFDGYRADYAWRRGVLLDALAAEGFDVTPPQGTYFATLDVTQLGADDGLALCRALPEAAGVAAVPLQVFYEDEADGRRWIRLAFCKEHEAMREGVRRLAAYRDAHA